MSQSTGVQKYKMMLPPPKKEKIQGQGFIVDMSEPLQNFHDLLSQFEYYDLVPARTTITELVNAPDIPFDMNPALELICQHADTQKIDLGNYDLILVELLYDNFSDHLFDFINEEIARPFERIQLSSWINKTCALLTIDDHFLCKR